MTLVLPWLVTMSLGGFKNSSAVIIWAALCPLVSLLVEDLRQTVLWIVGFVLLLMLSAILEPSLKPPNLPEAFVIWFFVLNLGSVIAIVFVLLYYFVAQRNFFQERSETLILNILPKEIADALKVERSAIAAHYEFASVLFADVVGFTAMASAMSSLSLVNLLNEVFSSFDDLVEKHGLEKIKTIGDRYMVASGVPRERADHALALVQLALDMRGVATSRTFGGETLAFRIGVNSGPVVAGVIGRKKFIYDLWGATVNLASRMESAWAKRGDPDHAQHLRVGQRGVRVRIRRNHGGEGRGRCGSVEGGWAQGWAIDSNGRILRSPHSGRLEGWSSKRRRFLSVPSTGSGRAFEAASRRTRTRSEDHDRLARGASDPSGRLSHNPQPVTPALSAGDAFRVARPFFHSRPIPAVLQREGRLSRSWAEPPATRRPWT